MDGTLAIEARLIHRRRNMVHAEVALAREDGQLVANATAAQTSLRS
jgi:acyl-coenzyme A thioesterase PaaI-like protein